MKRTWLLVVLALAAVPAAADQSGCSRELGPYHIPALLSSSLDELSKQSQCLILESTIAPKGMLLPPAALGPAGKGRTQGTIVHSPEGETILRSGSVPWRPPRSLEEAGRPASFGLGEAGALLRPER